jgi:hypothetical protein
LLGADIRNSSSSLGTREARPGPGKRFEALGGNFRGTTLTASKRSGLDSGEGTTNFRDLLATVHVESLEYLVIFSLRSSLLPIFVSGTPQVSLDLGRSAFEFLHLGCQLLFERAAISHEFNSKILFGNDSGWNSIL